MKNLKNKNLIIIIIVYIFITMYLINKDYILYKNIINPMFYGGMLLYIIWDSKNNYIRFTTNRRYLKYMIIISCVHVLIYFYLGFFLGFFKSPYSHKLTDILKNIAIQIIPVIGIEVIRNIIIITNKNNKYVLVIVTILFILVEINYNTLINNYSNKMELFKYTCEKIFPLIACNILYTYLSLKGSYSLPLTYRLFKEGVNIFLPIIPNVDWFIKGSVPIISSVIVYVLYQYKITKEEIDLRKKKETFFAKITYFIAIIFAITLIFFMLGIFKYQPIVILSNSMMPTFGRADVVIYKDLKENELYKIPNGSIIVYTLEEKNIAHRVVNIIEENGTVKYQTKGDRNNIVDENLVEVNQIKGEYVFNIKYVGFPSVWLYEAFNNNLEKVEKR